ncbi:MAG: VOC family protein [Planctomycetota bacterium]
MRCLDHLNLTVADLEATRAFYARVFDFTEVEHGVDDDGLPWAILQSGDALLCCYERPGYRLLDRVARKERGEHGIAHFALRLLDLPSSSSAEGPTTCR